MEPLRDKALIHIKAEEGDFRPRISTYGGRELTPYRLSTGSHADSLRDVCPHRHSATKLTTRVGMYSSSIGSLLTSFLPPKFDLHKDSNGINNGNPPGNGYSDNPKSQDGLCNGVTMVSVETSERTTQSEKYSGSSREPFRAWKVLVMCTLTFLLMGFNWVAFPLFYVELSEHVHASKSALGWVGSLQNAASMLVGGLVSAPLQLYGCRPVAALGGALLALGTALSAFCDSVLPLYLAYGVLSGIGLGMVSLSAMVIVQQNFCKNRTLATAIAMMGASVGQVLGPLLIDSLIQTYGWRGAMFIFGAIMFHATPFALAFTPVHPQAIHSVQSDLPTSVNDTKHKDKCHRMREIMHRMLDFSLLCDCSFTLFCLSFFLVKFNVLGFYQHLPSSVVHEGLTRQDAALLMTLTGVLAATSRIVAGFLGNIRCANRALMYAVAVTVAGADTVLLAYTRALAPLICAIFGACMGMTMLMASVVLVDLLGVERIAQSQGIFNVFSGVAGLLATPLSGWLFDVTSNYDVPFLVVGIMGILGGGLAFIVVILERRKYQQTLTDVDDT